MAINKLGSASKRFLKHAWIERLLLIEEAGKIWAGAQKSEHSGQSASILRIHQVSIGRNADADRLWAEAVLCAHGDIEMEWIERPPYSGRYDCRLSTGDVFKCDALEAWKKGK